MIARINPFLACIAAVCILIGFCFSPLKNTDRAEKPPPPPVPAPATAVIAVIANGLNGDGRFGRMNREMTRTGQTRIPKTHRDGDTYGAVAAPCS